MTVLFAHVRTGSWASVMPERVAQSMRKSKEFHAIPIVEPEVVHTIGLVMPLRDPTTPLVRRARRGSAPGGRPPDAAGWRKIGIPYDRP